MKFVSLKYKLALVYMAFIAEIFLVIVLMRYFWTIPQFLELEQIADRKDLLRIENAIDGKLSELALVNYDNAVWDDSYQFIQDGNQEFIEENFVLDTFQSLKLNGIYYYRADGQLIWGATYDRTTWLDIPPPTILDDPGQFLISPDDVESNSQHPVSRKGIIVTDSQSFMFTATSIMPSVGKGKSNGTLLFLRRILTEDEDLLAQLSSLEAVFIWPHSPEYPQVLSSLVEHQAGQRDANQQLLYVGYDFLSKAPYFVRIQASTRAFDISLIDSSLLMAMTFALLGIFFLFYFVSKRLIRPIARWNKKISTIVNQGNYSIRFTANGNDELSIFSRSFNKLLEYVEQQDKEIKRHNEELLELSNTDGLTKLYNRRFFDNAIHQLWQAPLPERPVTLCLLDIDFFKLYNDNYGHQMGDQVLRDVAQAVMENTKRSTDIVARYGGEEFVLILQDTELENGIKVAKNLCRQIYRLNIPHEHSALHRISVSIGVASILPDSTSKPRDLIHSADEALYQAKDQGKNRACVYKQLGKQIS